MPSIRRRYHNVCNADQIQSPITGKCLKKDRKTRVKKPKWEKGPEANAMIHKLLNEGIPIPRNFTKASLNRRYHAVCNADQIQSPTTGRCVKICPFGRLKSGRCRKQQLKTKI